MARGYDFDDYDPHESEIEELRAQCRFDRMRQSALRNHPDPRDPDHPEELEPEEVEE